MKRFSKFASIFLAMILVLSAVFTLVACESAESKALKTLILPEDETIVEEDFTLPKTLHSGEDSYPLTWTSGNEDAIKISDPGAESETYTASVSLQAETTPVTLTAKAGKATRDFRVMVAGVNALTFADNYQFSMTNKATTEDFDLETSWTYLGKSVTISWEVVGDSADYVEIQNGNKCHVINSPDDDSVQITLKATFTYSSTDKTTKNYSFTLSPKFTHEQEVLRRYSVAGSPLEIEGYILYINEVSESYGNATFWMIDNDFCSGYYMYHIKFNKEDMDKYVVGAHIKVSGDTAKNYNGLWENNGGGTAELVDDKVLTAAEIAEHTYDIDADLISGVDSALWHESTYVRLNGWKVKALAKSKPTEADKDLLTLTHSGVDIVVRLSKYVFTSDKTDELNGVIAWYDKIKTAMEQGDVYVNVTGLLGNYNAFQIQPVSADGIEIVSAQGVNNGSKLKDAVDAVNNAVKANFEGRTIVAETEVDMPVSTDGVKIEYAVAGNVSNPTVTINNETGDFTITPTATRKNYDIKVTYTIGEETYKGFFKLANQLLDDEGIVKAVRVALSLEKVDFEDDADLALPTNADAYGYNGVTIEWAVQAPEQTTWMTVVDNTLKVRQPATAQVGTLIATIKLGTAEVTRKFIITVTAANPNVIKLTSENFLGYSGENVYYNETEATKTVKDIEFKYTQIGAFGDGLQVRSSKTPHSNIYTSNGVGEGKVIASFVLVFNTAKYDRDLTGAFKLEFSNNADFSDADTQTIDTKKGTSTYTVTPNGNYKYVRFTWDGSNSGYITSITLNLKAE